MKEVWLQLNGRHFTYAQLKEGRFANSLSDFEKSTLGFCRDWIQGKDHFTLSTSGSTGSPKTISFRREQMEVSARLTSSALDLRPGYHALLCLDTRYVAGQMMLVRSFVTGMNIVAITPSANPFDLVEPGLRIDFTAVVPYQLQTILESATGKTKLDSLKEVLVGGAGVSEKLKNMVQELVCPVYSSYGMTETISHVALKRLNGPAANHYFQVLPGVSIATDERGCLTIAADHLGPSKVVTNDLVEIAGPETFQWLGRLDRVINTGGVKVIPEKVEAEAEKIMAAMGLARRCFVTGTSDDRLGTQVMLVVEGSPFSESLQQDFFTRLRGALGKYEVPREIKFIPRFVETPTLKIDQGATLTR
jgi:O-succinylbenzoic acid--CoA ligase